MENDHPLHLLIQQLQKLPGVGEKSAQRLAFFFLTMSKKDVATFSQSVTETRNRIRYCERCFNISTDAICNLCMDENRDNTSLCVVAEPKDVFALEKTGEFKGRYHVLGGLISPLDGIHPEVLRINELTGRLNSGVKEIILALNPTIEGEATMLYLSHLLKPKNIPLSKLAHGLPIGSDIDYADELTLQKSLLGRNRV